jgi:hypothetical protein
VLTTGGTTVVGGGSITVDGTSVVGPTLYPSGRTLEFVATFSGQPNQNAGFGLTTALIPPFAMFGVKSDGQFYARSVAPSTVLETPIPGAWFNAPHRFRIDWNASTVVYWIDGVVKATHAITYPPKNGAMRPAITDQTAGGGALVVDWMRMTPNAASGLYTSPVYDAGTSNATWQSASWLADLPAGTSVGMQVRTGNSLTPDTTWTGWSTVQNAVSFTAVARYAQYRLTLTTTVPNAAPSVKEVVVNIQR